MEVIDISKVNQEEQLLRQKLKELEQKKLLNSVDNLFSTLKSKVRIATVEAVEEAKRESIQELDQNKLLYKTLCDQGYKDYIEYIEKTRTVPFTSKIYYESRDYSSGRKKSLEIRVNHSYYSEKVLSTVCKYGSEKYYEIVQAMSDRGLTDNYTHYVDIKTSQVVFKGFKYKSDIYNSYDNSKKGVTPEQFVANMRYTIPSEVIGTYTTRTYKRFSTVAKKIDAYRERQIAKKKSKDTVSSNLKKVRKYLEKTYPEALEVSVTTEKVYRPKQASYNKYEYALKLQPNVYIKGTVFPEAYRKDEGNMANRVSQGRIVVHNPNDSLHETVQYVNKLLGK